MQNEPESPLNRILERITESRFTGLLRVRAHEADGELWFLAGVREEVRFGVSKGDDALARLLRSKFHSFEIDPRIPSLTGDLKKPIPVSGSFATINPVRLMRHCENYALTCTLELSANDKRARAVYRAGELLSVEVDSGGNTALAEMLKLEEGTYNLVVPPFEIPEGLGDAKISVAPPAPPEGSQRKSDQRALDARRHAAEAALEAQIKARQEAQARREQRETEAKQRAEAEAKQRAEAEAKQRAEAEAEAKRRAEAEAEAKRRAEAEAEAEAKRRAETEDKRRTDTGKAAKEAELAAAKPARDTARSAREADAADDDLAASSQPQRKSGFIWLVVVLLLALLAYAFYSGWLGALLPR